MTRSRITVQIEENARRKIDRLVYAHTARSVSDLVRKALEEYLKTAQGLSHLDS